MHASTMRSGVDACSRQRRPIHESMHRHRNKTTCSRSCAKDVWIRQLTSVAHDRVTFHKYVQETCLDRQVFRWCHACSPPLWPRYRSCDIVGLKPFAGLYEGEANVKLRSEAAAVPNKIVSPLDRERCVQFSSSAVVRSNLDHEITGLAKIGWVLRLRGRPSPTIQHSHIDSRPLKKTE